jgi:NAD(P)-dependent dehydrogenase (short-subunit alcohol dehydrogenase family)
VPFDSLTLLLPSATPRHAAARGVARALSHEWRARGTPVTTVTLTHEADPMQALALARALPGRHDLALQAQAASERVADPHPDLEGQGTERLSLDEDSVLLLYGGGVGIAAEVAVDLAQRYHLQVVAIGRTPWQGECPHPALQDPQALQQALLEDLMRQEGRAPEPARLSQLVQQAQRQRELARTAQRVRDAGGRFAYLSADLTSAEAVQACVQDVLRAHGRIDMVVHAAGVVEDRGLATKPVDSFLRVFRTKAHSAWLLRDALRNVPLKYMVFFSSLVSHTGNIGQTDYCAGNEVLNAMASEWAETAPETRVLSVLWSVWHETGLANRAVQQHMQRQGMAGIGNADGTRRLHAELARDTVPDWLLISCPRMFDTLQAGVA